MANTILLIDDDRDFLAEFSESLADEYNILQAFDCQTALSILKKPNEIDLVIIDQMLKGEKGTDFIKKIKKMKPDLGVILLTGHSTKQTALDAFHARADEYMEKPAQPLQVKEQISNVLDKNIRAKDGGVIERAKAMIEKNFEKKMTLENCASILCLSPKYLSRIFKKQAGLGFMDYKNKVRLKAAKEMLTKQKMNINQIAYQLGYKNAESFLRMFYKSVKMTPSKYRKKFAKF